MTQKFREQNNYGFDICYLSVDGTDVWCIVGVGYWQGIFRIDLETDIIHYVDEIPTEKHSFEYQVAVHANDKIIIAPFFSETGFLEYDLNQKRFFQKDIGKDIPRKFSTKFAFSNVVRYKDSLFFLANQSKSIIEYRISTGEYVVRKELEKILPHEITEENYKVDLCCYRLVNDTLFYIIQESNILVELNLDTFDGKYHEIPYIKKAENLHICGDKLYVTPIYSDPFVCVDMKNWKAEKILNLSPNENLMMWLGMVTLSKKCLLIPGRKAMIYSISDVDKKWKKEEDLSREWLGENPGGIILCDCVTPPEPDGRCFIRSKCNNCLIEIIAEKNIIVHKLNMPLSDWDTIRELVWSASNTLIENEPLSIHDFLNFVNKNGSLKQNQEEAKSFGASIYEMLSIQGGVS